MNSAELKYIHPGDLREETYKRIVHDAKYTTRTIGDMINEHLKDIRPACRDQAKKVGLELICEIDRLFNLDGFCPECRQHIETRCCLSCDLRLGIVSECEFK